MKKLCSFLILIFAISFSSFQNIHSANEGEKQKTVFSKGTQLLSIKNIGHIKSLTQNNDGISSDEINSTLNLSFTYMFLNNHGIIARLNYDRLLTESNSSYGYKQIIRDKMLYLGYMHGYQLSSSVGLYAAAMLGFGAARNFYSYIGSESVTDNSSLLTGFKLELGALLLPALTMPILFQPRIGYNFKNQQLDNGSILNSGFYFIASVAVALNAYDFYCKNKMRSALLNPYTAGLIFLTAGLTPYLKFGSEITKNDDYPNISDDLFKAGIRFGAGIFFINNLAAILAFNLNSGTKKGDNGYEQKNSLSKVAVGLRGQLPAENPYLNNIFFEGKVGIGRQKQETINSSYLNEIINNIFSYNLGLGYNYFLSRQLAISCALLYTYIKLSNISSNPNPTNNTSDLNSTSIDIHPKSAVISSDQPVVQTGFLLNAALIIYLNNQ